MIQKKQHSNIPLPLNSKYEDIELKMGFKYRIVGKVYDS